MRSLLAALWCFLVLCLLPVAVRADDVRDLQTQAIEKNHAEFGHWGSDPGNYMQWASHSNRLIPVYTFGTAHAGAGISLKSYLGKDSPYANEARLQKLYGQVPSGTLNPQPQYFDQTNIFDIQRAALKAGKKHIILVVFDGTDWQTTFAASTYQNGRVAYTSGRGTGLHLQDYQAGGTTEFGWMVTSPWCDEPTCDLDQQLVGSLDGVLRGGYDYQIAGEFPWSVPTDPEYIIGRGAPTTSRHAYTDSSTSAASMTAGIKSYNGSINVGPDGTHATTIAQLAQQQGYQVGVVTSVPICHATPAAAYAHNVHRDDYQDLSRDLLGLPSISHPAQPLPGLDLLIGAGFGVDRAKDEGQGKNFVPGNAYLTQEDLQKADLRSGGKYVVAQRTSGVMGLEELKQKAQEAKVGHHPLLGFFGTKYGHLPFRTADGNYDPTVGRKKVEESYTENDLNENPKLSQMAEVALDVLGSGDRPFWLMVEAGDVDWANHDNNIDNSIGALLSGDAAVKAITDWVEAHSSWEETLLIVTADHGHDLVLTHPELLAPDHQR